MNLGLITQVFMANDASTPSMFGSLIMFVPLLVVLYFFMIRPQKKKEKEEKQMRENIQIGDEITTIGGIVGIVVRKTEDTVVIETGGDKSKLRIKVWAIRENATLHEKIEEEKVNIKKSKSKEEKKETEE